MIPIRDENPTFLTPYVTIGLIALNCAAWILLQDLGRDPGLARSLCSLGMIPGDLLGTAPVGTRIPIGPHVACIITASASWHTLLTSMFMHGGWLHLLGNMWFLWIFGNNVEDAMGHMRFAAFYLLCGLVAALSQVAVDPASAVPMVGASGAIGGVMGAYVLLYPRVRVHLLLILGFIVTTVAVPAFLMLGYWFAIQVLSGMLDQNGGGGVAFAAHVGGFVAGALLAYVFRNPRLLRRHPHYGWRRR